MATDALLTKLRGSRTQKEMSIASSEASTAADLASGTSKGSADHNASLFNDTAQQFDKVCGFEQKLLRQSVCKSQRELAEAEAGLVLREEELFVWEEKYRQLCRDNEMKFQLAQKNTKSQPHRGRSTSRRTIERKMSLIAEAEEEDEKSDDADGGEEEEDEDNDGIQHASSMNTLSRMVAAELSALRCRWSQLEAGIQEMRRIEASPNSRAFCVQHRIDYFLAETQLHLRQKPLCQPNPRHVSPEKTRTPIHDGGVSTYEAVQPPVIQVRNVDIHKTDADCQRQMSASNSTITGHRDPSASVATSSSGPATSVIPSGTTDARCPQGHLLKQCHRNPPHLGTSGTLQCDLCGTSLDSGAVVLWGCRSCNYDVCSVCLLCLQVTCPAGHHLSQFATPNSSFSCNICTTAFNTGTTLWGCRACNFDVCRKCVLGTQIPKCPAGHELFHFTTQHDSFVCNFCKNSFPIGTILWGCRICNHDVCCNCIGAASWAESGHAQKPKHASTVQQPVVQQPLVQQLLVQQPFVQQPTLAAQQPSQQRLQLPIGSCLPEGITSVGGYSGSPSQHNLHLPVGSSMPEGIASIGGQNPSIIRGRSADSRSGGGRTTSDQWTAMARSPVRTPTNYSAAPANLIHPHRGVETTKHSYVLADPRFRNSYLTIPAMSGNPVSPHNAGNAASLRVTLEPICKAAGVPASLPLGRGGPPIAVPVTSLGRRHSGGSIQSSHILRPWQTKKS